MGNYKKSGGYVPSPTPSNFNRDVRNNEIMKKFNDMKEKTRVELTSLYDTNTFPAGCCTKMKK